MSPMSNDWRRSRGLTATDARRGVHAAVLAAGLSTRFGGIQKALYRFQGMSMLERSIRVLAAARVSTVSVVCGHRADEVRHALSEIPFEPLSAIDNPKYDIWNNFYSVELACQQVPPGDLVIINGDIIYSE